MNGETRTLINYRLERAQESLEEAKILLEQGHANTFVDTIKNLVKKELNEG